MKKPRYQIRVIMLALGIILDRKKRILLLRHERGHLFFPGGKVKKKNQDGEDIDQIFPNLLSATGFVHRLLQQASRRESARRAVQRETYEEIWEEPEPPIVQTALPIGQIQVLSFPLPAIEHYNAPGDGTSYRRPYQTKSVIVARFVILPKTWRREIARAIREGDTRIHWATREEIIHCRTEDGQVITPDVARILTALGVIAPSLNLPFPFAFGQDDTPTEEIRIPTPPRGI